MISEHFLINLLINLIIIIITLLIFESKFLEFFLFYQINILVRFYENLIVFIERLLIVFIEFINKINNMAQELELLFLFSHKSIK